MTPKRLVFILICALSIVACGESADPSFPAGDTLTGGSDVTDVAKPTDTFDDARPDATDGGLVDVTSAPHPTVPGELVITELMPNPTTVSDTEGGEWIELHNPATDRTFDIGGCVLRDATGESTELPSPLLLTPGAYVALAAGVTPGFAPDATYPAGALRLVNTADSVILDCDGVTIDEVAYDENTHPLEEGRSLSLDPAFTDATANDDPTNWCAGEDSYNGDRGTPGAPNPSCGDPPAAPTPDEPGALVISEIMVDPVTIGDGEGEWVELHNPSVEEAWDLRGCHLTSGDGESYTIPSAWVIPAGGYGIAAASASPGFAPDVVYEDLRLANGRDDVALRCGEVQIDIVAWDDGATFPSATGASMSLDGELLDAELNDLGDAWCEARAEDVYHEGNRGTPGFANPECTTTPAENQPTAAGQIVITEIMRDPETLGESGGEWFELHNPDPETSYDLRGCVLSDDGSDQHTIAGSLPVAPLGFATLSNGATPGFTPDYQYIGLQLANGEDEVVLTCGGVEIDRVAYGAAFPDTPGAAMSLDGLLYDWELNDYPEAWCAARPEDSYNGDRGTPGLDNPECPMR